MPGSLDAGLLDDVLGQLAVANGEFARTYPGIDVVRQPVHTLYGGANLYREGSSAKLGGLAVRHFDTYASGPETLVERLGMDAAIAGEVYQRVREKLAAEPGAI